MKGRIRSIKPEWTEDERLNACSDTAIRMSFVILSMVDDEGRCRASVRALGLAGWKFCDRVIDKTAHAQSAVSELVNAHWLIGYEADGYQQWQVRNFAKHQKISHFTASKLPPPPEVLPVLVTSPENSGGLRKTPEVSGVLRPDLDLDLDLDQGSGSGVGSGSAREAAPDDSTSPVGRLFAAYVAQVESATTRHEAMTPEKLKAARGALEELTRTAANRGVPVDELLTLSVSRWLADPWGKRTGWKFTEWAKQAAAIAVAEQPASKRGRSNVAPPTSHEEFARSVDELGGGEVGYVEVRI